MLRGFSLRDFGASLNTAESYTNESSQGKIGLCETANKQKCTHLGMFLASAKLTIGFNSTVSLSDLTTNNTYTTVVSIDNVKYTGYPCTGIVTVLSK